MKQQGIMINSNLRAFVSLDNSKIFAKAEALGITGTTLSEVKTTTETRLAMMELSVCRGILDPKTKPQLLDLFTDIEQFLAK